MTSFLFLMADPGGQGGGFAGLLFPLLIFAVFYFFIIRPQTKRQKEIQNKVAAIQKGDTVVTSGGLIGQVTGIEETEVTLEIDKGVKARFLKSSVLDVNPKK